MHSNGQRLKLGLIGCGAVAELFYAPALKEIEKSGMLNVDMLCDPVKENAHRLAKLFPNASIYENFSPADLDLVIVASPAYLHCEQTIAALASGAAVLCEKPMAISFSQCQAMNASARSSGRLLSVGLIRRFFPASRLIQHVVESQILGRVKFVDFTEGTAFSWPARSGSFFNKEQAGGGVLMDSGSHVLDLLLWWLGQPEITQYEDDAMGGVETNCRVKLKYAGDSHGIVRLSRDCQLANKCYIEFEQGWLRWNLSDVNSIELSFQQESITLGGVRLTKGSKDSVFHTAARPLTLHEIFIDQINNVLASIAGKDKLVVSGEEASKCIESIERCYRERSLIAMPWLSADEWARGRKLGSSEAVC